jgi:hypothetical protein
VAALALNALSIWFSYVSVAFVRTATRKTSRMSADVMVRRAEGVRLIVAFAFESCGLTAVPNLNSWNSIDLKGIFQSQESEGIFSRDSL